MNPKKIVLATCLAVYWSASVSAQNLLGLGFAVRTDAGHSPLSGSLGDYFWAGAFGTYFWVDPQERFFAVMMVQMPFAQSGYYRRAFRELVYGALLH